MLTVTLGPLTFAAGHLLLLGSLLLATLTGWWVGRRHAQNPEKQLFRLFLVGLLVARLAFVVVYSQHFADEPWKVLDIRDGGFIAWPGILAALLLGAWQAWRAPGLRKPLGVALAVGVLSWTFSSLAWHAFEHGTQLPKMALRDTQGAPVALESYRGKPLVINLWATWCPPCRREMPVLAEAQARETDLTFLFVNQGEGSAQIVDFLEETNLQLHNVLLDSGARLGQQLGSQALPTTLFYDAQGRQVGSHLGELSRASLARSLEKLKEHPQP